MSTRVAKKQKTINTIHYLEDVDSSPAPNNISYTLGELDPWEREKEKRGGPIEELESIQVDDQHPECTVQVGSQLPGYLRDQLVSFLRQHKDVVPWSHEDMPRSILPS